MDRAGKDWFKKDIEILRMNAVRRMRWTNGEGKVTEIVQEIIERGSLTCENEASLNIS